MDIGKILFDLFFDYTLRTVALGAATLGIVSGALGAFAVLRKQSLLGDAVSHAALPGIVIAFLLTGSKEPLTLILGAVATGWLATLLLLRITSSTRISYDSAMGFVLSVFFGLGLMLLTYVQRLPNASQAGLDKFLFGQAAAILESDVILMAALGGVSLLVLALLWKEFKLLSFDPEFLVSLGLPQRGLDVLLTTLMVIAIVIGLQAVGVVLMSAMLVAPGAAARQWTDRLGRMVALSAGFGALAGVSGAVLSSTLPHLSTGPTIVLCASALVLVSLLLAPNRGLAWKEVRRQRSRQKLQTGAVLSGLYTLASQHDDFQHPHSIQVLRAMMAEREGPSQPPSGVARSLRALAAGGWVRQVDRDQWTLTAAGLERARSQAGGGEQRVEADNQQEPEVKQ